MTSDRDLAKPDVVVQLAHAVPSSPQRMTMTMICAEGPQRSHDDQPKRMTMLRRTPA